ncbi:MAG: FprA family A-type flavoprotein [Deltaproteobacteria bacterium]
MKAKELKPNVFYTGAIDWDRRLFDSLISLPEGTSYNSYLVKGSQKVALIDTVDTSKENELLSNLRDLEVNIDYVVVQHAEQDHSGTIPKVLEMYPDAKILCNPKCKDLLIEMLLIPIDKIVTVDDGETVSLGNKTLEFIYTSWVHWPETMVTYLKEDKILFSCDFLGAHYASSKLFVDDEKAVYSAAKRYFAEIMMPFRNNIKTNLEKIGGLEIEIIAPSHGQVYKDPDFIMDAYKEWSSDEVKNLVIVPYVSMHGSTTKMVEYLVSALSERGIPAKPFNLSVTDIGELAMNLVDAATVVIGSPAVLAGPHPIAMNAVYLVNVLRPKTHFTSIIGSYGWGSRMTEIISSGLTNVKAEMVEPVVVKGYPKEDDFKALDKMADEIFNKHKQADIL